MKRFLFIWGLLLPALGAAHPVSYKGAVSLMTWNQPFLSDHWLTYSFTPWAAIAARSMRMEMPGGQYNVFFPQLDVLLKRWNGENSQANIYVYGGFGGARHHTVNGNAGLVGAEVDAESRKYFVLAKWESMWSNIAEPFHHLEFRLGIAPWEAEFEELASWFMVQFQYHPSVAPDTVITPLYRMFYRNMLWEAGVSLAGDFMLNFMFHF